MARTKKVIPTYEKPKFVNFNFEDRVYQIDPSLKKVYRRFVEIETSKASLILSSWRAIAAV